MMKTTRQFNKSKGLPLPGILLLALGLFSISASANDPWREVNERVFAFNNFFDQVLLKPVARSYGNLPSPVKQGVGNFFSNIDDINELLNNLMQLKVEDALSDSGRLLVNSTIGIGGLLDVATELGLEKHQEDFGQTLGYWGVGSGPYVMLPFLGSSSVRDSLGIVFSAYANPFQYHDQESVRTAIFALREVRNRESLLYLDDIVTFDEYLFLREGYLQRREFLVKDGVVADEFGDF